jgi:hypothetical protein
MRDHWRLFGFEGGARIVATTGRTERAVIA